MSYPTYLIHYGTPGQKWGERRFQNEDGTWTEEGKKRRRIDTSKLPHYGGKGVQAPLGSAGYYEKDKDGNFRSDNDWNRVKSEKAKESDETDYVVKKGSIYKRITSEKDEKFNKRMYVGGGEVNDEEFDTMYIETLGSLWSAENVYINTLETKKDTIIAGKKTVESILKEIGGEDANKIIKAFNTEKKKMPTFSTSKDGKMYNIFGIETKKYKEYKENFKKWEKEENERYNRIDFLYKDNYKIADEFIKKLKDKGYDGLGDPADGILLDKNGFDPDAVIFVNDVLKRTGQRKYGG